MTSNYLPESPPPYTIPGGGLEFQHMNFSRTRIFSLNHLCVSKSEQRMGQWKRFAWIPVQDQGWWWHLGLSRWDRRNLRVCSVLWHEKYSLHWGRYFLTSSLGLGKIFLMTVLPPFALTSPSWSILWGLWDFLILCLWGLVGIWELSWH